MLSIPAIIFLAIYAFAITEALVKHGKPVPARRYNAYIAVVAVAIGIGLLWWGGFFQPVA